MVATGINGSSLDDATRREDRQMIPCNKFLGDSITQAFHIKYLNNRRWSLGTITFDG